MEDGLELSLGLSLGAGGSSGKSKGATDAPVEPKAEPQVEESSSRGVSQPPDAPFVHYYQTNAENQEHSSKQRQSPTPPFGNFWAQQGGSSAPAADVSNEPITHQSQLPRYQDGWNSNNKGKYPEENNPVSSKRKVLSEETSFQKKHHAAADQPDAFSKCSDGGVKNAPISISTDDGSTGENEDVVDSEAEGSNSWIVAQREDSAKGSVVNRGSDIKRSGDEAAGGFQGKRQPSFSGSESSSGKLPHGNLLQASNVVAVPYQGQTQASVPPGIINASNFPPISSVQFRPPISNGPAIQATGGTGASQVAFGYPTGQLPILETGSSWAFGTPPQAISFTSKQAERAGAKQADDGKKPQEAGASSAHVVGDKTADRVLPLMGSAIRPGIAPNVKFGGSGSYPDLPWVSTTGTGPNGRTISGVTYNFGRNEVKIVCACHGTHMAPEEFIRHASADATGQENNSTMPAFPAGNQAASAQN